METPSGAQIKLVCSSCAASFMGPEAALSGQRECPSCKKIVVFRLAPDEPDSRAAASTSSTTGMANVIHYAGCKDGTAWDRMGPSNQVSPCTNRGIVYKGPLSAS